MYIKDKFGNDRMILSNFKNNYPNSLPLFLEVLVEITMDNLYSKQVIEFEVLDFIQMKKHFNLIETGKIKTFFLKPISKQFQIKIESLFTGNIEVSGILTDNLFLNSANFCFESTITELEIFINSIMNKLIEMEIIK